MPVVSTSKYGTQATDVRALYITAITEWRKSITYDSFDRETLWSDIVSWRDEKLSDRTSRIFDQFFFRGVSRYRNVHLP